MRRALGTMSAPPKDFASAIEAVREYLTGRADITMRPAHNGHIPLFVLGTGSGLKIAARLGLPAVVGGPLLTAGPEAFDEYRSTFCPSEQLDEPYLIASTEIFVADSPSEARELSLPEAWAMSESRLTGAFPPLEPTTSLPDSLTQRQQRNVAKALAPVIAGTEDQVLSAISELLVRTGADEIMSTASTFDTTALYTSDARLAAAVAATL